MVSPSDKESRRPSNASHADPAKASSAKAGSAKAGSAKRTKKPGSGNSKQQELPEPVFGGRLLLATAFCLAMVFIPLSPLREVIAKESPKSQERDEWQEGTEGTVHVTVITADFNKLACADEREIEGMHCAYKNDKEPFPIPTEAPYDNNKKNILQPYRTTDGQLLFMAGLWAQPEVAMRLHNEPPRGVAEKKLARFVAECRVAFLEEWQKTKFRWGPRESWSQGETGMVARPLECRIFQGKER